MLSLSLKSNPSWFLFVILLPICVIVTSCEDDDDEPSPKEQNEDDSTDSNEHEAEEGSYDIAIEGAVEAQMAGGKTVIPSGPFGSTGGYDSTRDVILTIAMTDLAEEEHVLYLDVFKKNASQIDEGTYQITLQDHPDEFKTGSALFLETIDETYYLPPIPTEENPNPYEGNVEITSVTETEVAGKINNVLLKGHHDSTSTVTITGAFHVLKDQ